MGALAVLGAPDRAGVLLLHPLGVDHRFFDPLVAQLPDVPVTRCDLPGHGATGPTGDVTLADVTDRLADALRAAGAVPQVVVGVSLGGLVAQQLAAAAPDLVAGLVLLDTVARYPDPMRQQWRSRAEALEAGTASVSDHLAATREVWFDEEAGADAVGYLTEALADADAAGYAEACRVLESADTTELVPALTVPAAVACGVAGPPAFRAAVDWFGTHLPGATTHELPHRHATALQDPAPTAGVVRTVLDRLPAATGARS